MSNKQLFDPIRQKKIALLPEEIVRQKLLTLMVDQLQFPKGLIAVEKELSSLPHLKEQGLGQKLPLRRMDILVFGRNIHPLYPLYPLLMIECKKDQLTEAALNQVVGYNYYVQAYFVAVAGKEGIKVFFQDQKSQEAKTLDFLPSYLELMRAVKSQKAVKK